MRLAIISRSRFLKSNSLEEFKKYPYYSPSSSLVLYLMRGGILPFSSWCL
jgi:hypothetical protein